MAAIMALGAGSLFLTTMNLRVAENSRTHAVARNNAEAGMEVATIKLRQEYAAATPRQFPASLTLPTSSGVTYQLSSYTPYTSSGQRNQARVIIVGTGPNNARYQTEALFGAASSSSSSSAAPNFPRGLISEGVVTAQGDHELYNAKIHGNKGFDLNGNGKGYYRCTGTPEVCANTGDATGDFISAGIKTIGDVWNHTCRAKKSLCAGNPAQPKSTYLKEKVTIGTPPYVARRNAVFGTTSLTTTTETSPAVCNTSNTVSSLGNSYSAGSTVCVNGNVNITNDRTYSNVRIIVKGTVTLRANVTLNNTNILSTGALLIEGNANMNTSRLYSDTDVTVNGNVPYTGASTIAAGRDMTLKGNIEHTVSNDIGMGLMAFRNFTATGNMKGSGSGSAKFVNVIVWAGGTASVSGASQIRGGISAVGNLNVNGASDIDGRGTLTNTDLSMTTNATVLEATALSRR